MFNFLKEKLKGVLNKFSKKVEVEAPEEKVIVEKTIVSPNLAKGEKKTEDVPCSKKSKEEKSVSKEEKKGRSQKIESKKNEKRQKLQKIISEVEPEFVSREKPIVQETIAPPVPVKDVGLAVNAEREEIFQPQKSKGFFARLKETFVGKEDPLVETAQEKEPTKEVQEVSTLEKKSFFQRITETITTKKISEEKFDELFWDLELALLENSVAVEVIEKIKADLKAELVNKPIPRGEVEERIASSLHESIEGLFSVPSLDLFAKTKEKKPLVICFVGINGSGKTTTIAKVTHLLQKHGLSVVLAAADTFRAAAIDQLQLHADKLGVKLIRHNYGSDPAAVAFDAIKHAEATKKDVVLIDTAGRLHSNVNLMDEMKKIIRVAKPDLKLFIGESITGNDCVEQAKQFDSVVGIDGIILSKADVDEKGGAAISVSFVTKKPILYLGVGQEYDDLQPFDKEKLLANIGL